MIYYNQNDYGHVPYPAKGYEKATVKSGGCGVVCASMVVETLTGKLFPPERAANFAIVCGARVPGGTDMRALAGAICCEFGMACKTSNSISALTATLRSGGMAIANMGGDRSGYKGVFSNGGHYVVVFGISGGQLQIADPGLYNGKYNKSHRKAVTVKGDTVMAAPEVLDKDCANRSPRYYLFTKEGKTVATDKPSAWAKDAWEKAKKLGIMDGTKPQEPLTREQLAVVLDRLELLKR